MPTPSREDHWQLRLRLPWHPRGGFPLDLPQHQQLEPGRGNIFDHWTDAICSTTRLFLGIGLRGARPEELRYELLLTLVRNFQAIHQIGVDGGSFSIGKTWHYVLESSSSTEHVLKTKILLPRHSKQFLSVGTVRMQANFTQFSKERVLQMSNRWPHAV